MAKLAIYLLVQLSLALICTPLPATTKIDPVLKDIGNTIRPDHFPESIPEISTYLSSQASKIQHNEQILVQTSLSVCLDRAMYAKSFVTNLSRVTGVNPMESRALTDCYVNLQGSIDRLSQSIDELEAMKKSVNGADYEWHASNLRTWVSGALTNVNTCLDGFTRSDMDGTVKVHVRSTILDLARITSNALALCEGFASRYKPVVKP